MKAKAEPKETPASQDSNLSRRVDRSLLISLVAVAISLIGTLVSVYEARVLSNQQSLQTEQKSASAWPFPAVEPNVNRINDTTAVLFYQLVNTGIGPAILGDVKYLYNGEDRETFTLDDAMREDYPDVSFKMTQNWQIDSLVLPPEKDLIIFSININVGHKEDVQEVANEIINKTSIEFCYCSVYGDCWYRGRGIAPIKNPDCKGYIDY